MADDMMRAMLVSAVRSRGRHRAQAWQPNAPSGDGTAKSQWGEQHALSHGRAITHSGRPHGARAADPQGDDTKRPPPEGDARAHHGGQGGELGFSVVKGADCNWQWTPGGADWGSLHLDAGR